MPLANCLRCRKLFDKIEAAICPQCAPLEEDDFQKVKEWLREHPNQSVDQLHQATGVDKKTILRFIEEDRIAADASEGIRCGKCGAPAVSFSVRLCQRCSNEMMRSAEAAVQKKILEREKKASPHSAHDGSESVREMMDRKRGH